ncbi:limonene-1,2-epoxide hydrolase family protein [Croceicoccus sediminis]|uniref:limonene-1,2-epoxide hydrolase family protein n=1 Tax=Croceicoccus sediminis TaxID=2571150 RepID=UPI00147877ED|nr:limonene-1,2-epoxide hydrolase family protein [Croceicoccus sediminis]
MPTSTEVVENFLDLCTKGKAGIQQALREYFTPETVWENVGLACTTGVDEALAFLAEAEQSAGITHFAVEMLSIVAGGDRVLTERVDHLVTPDGTPVVTIRLMGIFEVADGKIAAWRDYFDPAPLKG